MEVEFGRFFEGDFVPDGARIVCVAGGSGSGKSFVAGKIAEKIGARLISMDDYIIPSKITHDSDWDLAECWDLDLLKNNISDFLSGKDFEKPIYDFKTGRILRREVFEAGGKVVVEGLYALHDLIREFADFAVFVEAREEVRLARVVGRDLLERKGASSEKKVVKRWREMVQPAFLKYVEGQRDFANLVLLND